jgi:dTDP-glucose 4,6-dehydratase
MADAIVVTGGAGFIGSWFVRDLLASSGARVVAFDKMTYAGHEETLADVARHPRFTLVRGDCASASDARALFEAHRPIAVVHFAAETHVDRSIDGPRAFVEANVGGTFEMLNAALAHFESLDDDAKRRFRFVHVSTDEVYGELPFDSRDAFTESSPHAPSSPYSATKAAADHLVHAFHRTYGLPTLATSGTNTFGPYQYPEKLVPLITTRALDGEPLPIYGDGLYVRDWLDVRDHAEAVRGVLERGRPGERYNVGAGNERTNLQIVDAVCDALDRAVPASRPHAALKTFVADRPGHDRRYAVDTTKIARELGWRARRDFAPSLDETVRWYVANRAWCEAMGRVRYERARVAR